MLLITVSLSCSISCVW